ncbi:MAG: hypothetical protein H6751_14285 [Candidatus Omnitrophica bacterium]|nr:hypothetical protein [Candidatus Omnitrophota bacterium]MCB9784129.1 hypothetical protein [Candidatus Omnitrophota bacterium]
MSRLGVKPFAKVSPPFALLVCGFLLSRLWFWIQGLTFNDSCLYWFYQYLDVDLLENDLFASLWRLHAQPPLLNLLAGIGLKMTLPLGWWFWRIVYWGMGLAQTLLLFDTMKRLGVHAWLAVALVGAYMISPGVLLFENWLFYPYPAATLLILSTWLLVNSSENLPTRGLFVFFLVCSCLPLLRSLFHLVWLLGVIAILWFLRPKAWKRILLTAALPLLLVTGWYAKNLILFDTFSGSSWMGMNFARATVFRLPDQQREEWIKEGVLSKISSVGPFSPVERYMSLIAMPDATGFTCLDETRRGGSSPNYNHLSYIEVSKEYERDAWTVVRRKPLWWLGKIAQNLLIFFRPVQEFGLRSGNQSSIEGWESVYDRWVNGQIRPSDINKAVDGRLPAVSMWLALCYLWVLIYPMSLALGFYWIGTGRGRERLAKNALVIAFIIFNIVYLMLIGNIFEYGENNRFRFMSDPLVLILSSIALNNGFSRVKNRIGKNESKG